MTSPSTSVCPLCGAALTHGVTACPDCHLPSVTPSDSAALGPDPAAATAPTPARERQIIAGILSTLLALIVFLSYLIVQKALAHPGSAASATPIVPIVANNLQPIRSATLGSTPAPTASPIEVAPESDDEVDVYWRFATAEFLAGHPGVNASAPTAPPGSSLSIVRIDVENHGSAAISVNPAGFELSVPGRTAHAMAAGGEDGAMLPDLLQRSMVAPGARVEGWLAFLKPWDQAVEQTTPSHLLDPELPTARVSLSGRVAASTTGPENSTDTAAGGSAAGGTAAVTSSMVSPSPAPGQLIITHSEGS